MMTFGPPKLYRPVCIRHPHGFYGGPAGYERTEDPNSGPLILVAGIICRSDSMTTHNRVPDPTPDELAARRAEIQAGWTEADERNRRGCRADDPVYEIPVVPARCLELQPDRATI